MRRSTIPLLALAVAWPAWADETEDLITSAEAAAPSAVSTGAAIYSIDEAGAMVTLREGTDGWWCMPDSPATPGPDPMCGDANAMEWAMAWINQAEPPAGKPGFMYMLVEGSDASNTDPYAMEPAEGNNWITTGAHVMVVNSPEMLETYPQNPEPDTSMPYVMWAGTPYAHLMIPVQ